MMSMGMSSSSRRENMRDGRLHLNWFEMNQKNKPQSNALATGILMMLVSGMHIGWGIFNTELKFQKWAHNQGSNTILMAIISWYIAAIIGSCCGAPIVNKYGKKKICLLVLTMFTASGVILTSVPKEVTAIFSARIIAGLAHGIIFVMSMVHAGEIVIKELRGMIVASFNYVLFAAVLTAAGFNITVFNYNKSERETTLDPNQWIGILTLVYVALAAIITAFLTYESPVFLLRQGKTVEAIHTMMKLRNESDETWEIRNDIEEFKTMLSEDQQTSPSVFEDGNMRPLGLISLIQLVSSLSFNYPLNYIRITCILAIFGPEVEYNFATIIMPSIRMSLGVIVLFTVDKFGRKPHFTLSAGASSVILIVTGIMYAAGEKSISLKVFGSVLLAYDVFCSIGIGSVPDIFTSEAFASTKKSWSIALTQSLAHLIQIILVATTFKEGFTKTLIVSILLTFGIVMLICTIILHKTLPETTKMSIRQTRTEFTRRGEIVFSGTKQPTDANIYS